jgi:hypothetical protein
MPSRLPRIIQERWAEGRGVHVNNACNGFATSLQIADSFIRSQTYCCIAIVCGEVGSPFIPWHLAEGLEPPASTIGALTLGDGAGAALVTRSESLDGILAMSFMTDPPLAPRCSVGALHPRRSTTSRPRLFDDADYVPGGRRDAEGRRTRGDVDIIVGHQVSLAMTRSSPNFDESSTSPSTLPRAGNNVGSIGRFHTPSPRPAPERHKVLGRVRGRLRRLASPSVSMEKAYPRRRCGRL